MQVIELNSFAGSAATAHIAGAIGCGSDGRDLVWVNDAGEMYLVNRETGEIVISIKRRSAKASVVPHWVKLDVGVDTCFPCDAREPQELKEAAAVHDRWGNLPNVNHYGITHLLDMGVSRDAVRAFTHFAECLVSRNYWFGKLDDLDDSLDLATRTRKRAVAELVEAGLLLVETQGKALPTRVAVHPWYSYRGDCKGLEPALAAWLRRTRRAPV
ncbi:hypothetical protein [Stutzerimonas frequens]|uniref:hypothetical protein n=1 Tax=Stutzerimonas frequens TaxID=2968969 RepID=UPI00190B88D7|nr:hypothetical protein [Stutzerimonas frequens]MBK3874001.1 hypothetical protein [Stutzerimonas frequens]MBK3912270.1 hypothetical protein [Stutzerimonas frequens]MBK3931553.1 hypothetical protein [Stutzerimonas frequens]